MVSDRLHKDKQGGITSVGRPSILSIFFETGSVVELLCQTTLSVLSPVQKTYFVLSRSRDLVDCGARYHVRPILVDSRCKNDVTR